MTGNQQPTGDGIAIRDNPERQRYELFVGGTLAGLITYRIGEGRMVVPHTEVAPQYESRGLAARLATFALDDARRRGLAVVSGCEYIDVFVRRHPEYADLLADVA